MARIRRAQNVVLLLVAACVSLASAQFGGSSPPPKAPAVVADIPYIKCGVCQAFVKQAMSAVKTLRTDEKPGKKVLDSMLSLKAARVRVVLDL